MASQERFALHRFAAQVNRLSAAVANINDFVQCTERRTVCINSGSPGAISSAPSDGDTDGAGAGAAVAAAAASDSNTPTGSSHHHHRVSVHATAFGAVVSAGITASDWGQRQDAVERGLMSLVETLEQQVMLAKVGG